MKNIIILGIGIFLLVSPIRAQDQRIKDYLDAYIGENAPPYLQPLADLLASNLHSNIWDWSHFDDRFYIRLKAQAMASYPSEPMRTFEGKTTGDFQPAQTVTASTIIGDKRDILLQGENNTFYIFPGGYDLRTLILGTPQLTIGGFLHTEISGKFLSFTLEESLDRIRCLGIGGRHSLSAYFKSSPVDVSVGYFYHHIEAGTYLDNDQHLVSVHLGKSGKIVSGQLMIGYQVSNSGIHYVYEEGEDAYTVDLQLKNENPWLMEASGSLRLGPVFVTVGANYARFFTLSGGAGLIL